MICWNIVGGGGRGCGIHSVISPSVPFYVVIQGKSLLTMKCISAVTSAIGFTKVSIVLENA
jgi:hypothetical protein